MKLHNIKYILILFFLLILSGCTTNYSLNINKDNIINETIIVKDKTNNLDNSSYGSADQIIEMILNDQYTNVSGYRIEKIEGKYSGIKLTRTYYSFDDYKTKSVAYKYLTEKIKIEKSKGIIKIETGNIKNINKSDLYKVDKLNINIKLPNYKVINGNHNKSNNSEYIWNIDVNNKKNIKFSYNENKQINPYKKEIFILIILGLISALVIKKESIFRRKK